MLTDQSSSLCLIFNVFQAIAIHLFPEIVNHLNQALISRGVIYDVMVGLIGLGDFHLRTSFHYRLEMIFRIAEGYKLFIGNALTGKIRRKLFQRTAHFQNILERLMGYLSDFRTASRNHQNQTLELQLSNGFSDRCPGYSQFFCQLNLHEPLARLQFAL